MESSNKSIASLNIELPEGQELTVGSKKKGFVPTYYKICQGNIYKENDKVKSSLDAYELMSTFTPQEWFVLNTLKEIGFVHYDKDNKKFYSSNIVSTKSCNLNPTKKNQFSTGFKRLKDKSIVRRIKRQLYIINPDFQIPTYYEKEKEIWDSIT